MAQPKQKVDMARYAAVDALVQMHRGDFSGKAVAALEKARLAPRDRAFAGALFFGAAERVATLDYLLAPYLKKPVERMDTEVRAVLECGLHQLLFMRVPQSAAVNESVKLARAFGKSSAAGLVNAVLRKAGTDTAPLRKEQVQEAGEANRPETGLDFSTMPFESELQRVCVTWSVGEAVAEAVMATLPEDYDDFFAACFSGGEVCLRANTLKTNREGLTEKLAREGIAARSGQLPDALYAIVPGGVAGEAHFAEGLYHVQGEASQFACACLGVEPGHRVLDLCAAPGGKSATLAQQLGTGEGLCACDLREGRLKLVRETFAHLGVENAAVLRNDAAVYRAELARQDRVLCDVPCSGLGVLAQKPDLRYIKGDGFAALPALQLKILSTAARYVKQGGRLVYSTCTVRRQENADVVQAFLAQCGAEYRLLPPPAVPRGALLQDGMMTLLPHRTKTDGFFVAVLERL